MKTRTLKKALSLFLAVLMIALAIPFTLLTFADEATEIEIANFSVFGKYSSASEGDSEKDIKSNDFCEIGDAVDGKLSDADGTYFQTKGYKDIVYTMCYFDENGKMQNGTNASGNSYYGIFIVELSGITNVDTLSLWSIDKWGEVWMANNGYEIWYSEDGQRYEHFSSYENASNKSTYSKSEFSDGTERYVHDIRMNEVRAQYIAIAVTDYVRDGDANGNEKYKEMIFYEIAVTGVKHEATEMEIASFSAFGKQEGDYNPVFKEDGKAANAFDGNISTYAQTACAGKDKSYNMCFFDADGKITDGTNPNGESYYGIFIVELENYAKVDTLSLWGSDADGFVWMSNNGYDIYYSADGKSYTSVAGASFENFLEKQTNSNTKDDLYVEGTYGDKEGYVHDIAMGLVVAKYIAIAVTDYVPDSGNKPYKEMIFWEIAVTGFAAEDPIAPKLAINSFSVFGKPSDENELNFNDNAPAERAFDGNIETEAQTKNNAETSYEMCYFDADGKMKNGTKDIVTSYYGIFIVELKNCAKVDTLSLWGSRDYGAGWMSNNGYDIYYSVDGESYTAVNGASFKNFLDKQTNDNTEDDLYKGGTYNSVTGYVHDIAMGGVKAKYIAIAVSDYAPASDNYNDEMLFWEIVVDGAKTTAPKGNIKYFTPYGVRLEDKFPASRAFDGDIKTEAQAYSGKESPSKESYTKKSFEELMTGTTNLDAAGKSYYGLFEIELYEAIEVSSLSLWTSYYDDATYPEFVANNGYDIYYSVDGKSYSAVKDATFKNVYTNKASYYVESMYGSDKGHVHDIDMRDVKAQYIVIAVSDTVADPTERYSYMDFYEIAVHGTPTALEIDKVDAFGRHLVPETGATQNFSFYNDGPISNAFDGDIGTYAQNANHDRNGETIKGYEMCYFDADGVMANGENPEADGKSYYLIFVIKLEDYAQVDTLSLWTPYVNAENPADRPYMSNNGYDIYYSTDGKSYNAVSGASFEDVYTKQSTADALYVEGTYNGKDGHVHNIDMGGVEARYIAIAVSDIVYNAHEAIISEVTVNGGAPKKALDIGASVRMSDPTGIRFTGTVARTYYDRLVKDYGKDNVKMGILITPTEYLDNVDEFTKEALDAWRGAATKYLEIDANVILADGNATYRINCAMVNVLEHNYDREFSAILYVKVTKDGVTEYIYSGFSKTSNSRSIAYVASAALSDVRDEADSSYKYPVTVVTGETKYSPYDAENRKVLEGFSSKASTITVMTYNIKAYGEGDIWDKITGNEEGWNGRDPVYALETITEVMPDVVGLQEDDDYLYAEYSKVPAIEENYTRLNSNGNGSENNEILVKTAKFNVIKDGVEYFKELATVYSGHADVSDSRVDWDNDTKGDKVNGKAKGRFFRWVLVEDKITKERFLVVNTHLHYKAWLTDDEATNADCNKYLRRAQATLIRLWLLDKSEMCANQIVMGDLNSTQNAHSTMGLLSGIGALDQADTDAAIAVNVGGTLVKDGFSTREPYVFDYVLYNSDSLNAIEYVVVDNYDEGAPTLYPSDHLPVYAKFIAK